MRLVLLLATALAMGAVALASAPVREETASLLDELERRLQVDDDVGAAETALRIGLACPDSARVRTLLEIADRYQDQQDPASLDVAEGYVDSARALLEAAGRTDDADAAYALLMTGIVEYRRGRYDETLEHGARAQALYESLPDPPVLDYCRTLNLLAALKKGLERPVEEIKDLFLRAIATLDAAGGDTLAQSGYYRHNLAELIVQEEADYDTALVLISEALENFERTKPGPERVGPSYTLRGDIHRLQGDFQAARRDYRTARQMTTAAIHPDHPGLRYIHNSLGLIQTALGDYPEAIASYRECLRIMADGLPETDPDQAVFRTNLGRCYIAMGRLHSAVAVLDSALALHDLRGPRGRPAAATMLELAIAKGRLGDNTEAEALLLEALEIFRAHLPPTHFRIGETLMELGALYRRTGRYDEAERWLTTALRVFREGPGAEDVTRVEPLVELGELHLAQRRWRRAAAPLELAMRIASSKDVRHDVRIRLLGALSTLRYVQGDLRAALELALENAESHRKLLEGSLRAMSMDQALRYAGREVSGLGEACRLMIESGEAWDVESVWDELILLRGQVQTEMRIRRRLIDAEADPDLSEDAREYRAATREIVTSAVQGIAASGSEADDIDTRQAQLNQERHDRRIEAARRNRDDAGRRLAARSQHLQAITEAKSLDLSDIVERLPHRSALVAYQRIDLQLAPIDAERPAYIALVRPRDGTGAAAIDLGDAREIDGLIEAWRSALRDAARRESPTRGDDGPYARTALAAGRALRRAVLDPVRKQLDGVRELFLVPDDQLALVNLDALPEEGDGYVVESGLAIRLLSMERDLVVLGEIVPGANGLLAVGDPEFGAPPADRGGTGLYDGLAFAPLPGTAAEIADVNAVASEHAPVSVLTGISADERSVVEALPGWGYVHLATHGFFLEPGPDPDGLVRTNPMLLSGLALAGANTRARADDGYEGLLTAEEINLLSLEGCRWVVLSACRTGLGEIHQGEGVIGLRRAFQLAGARTVIMSLQDVGDRETADWMSRLYRGRFHEGLDTAASLRAACLSILDERRARGARTLPCDWGAFVAVGDWR